MVVGVATSPVTVPLLGEIVFDTTFDIKTQDEGILDATGDTTETIEDKITRYADFYGVSAEVMSRVIAGESGFQCDIYGDSGKAFGIAQFHRPTFNAFSKELGETLDYYSCEDQIKLMAWALSKGYGRHWTVYRWYYK